MKLSKIKLLPLAVAIFSYGLTGCLKDKDFEDGSIQSQHANGSTPKVVEIKLTAGDASNFFAASFDNSPNDTTVQLVPINLATKDPAPQDLHITVASDQSLVDNYNDANGTAYGDASAFYTLEDGGIVTIPQGSYTGFLKIKFKPSSFLGADWAIGFRITAIQESGYTISGNLATSVVAIIIKNEFDGNYVCTGARTRFNGPTEASGVLDQFTIDATNYFGSLGATTIVGQLADDGSGGTMSLTVNPDGTVTVANPPGGTYPDLTTTAGKTSTYDAATKTFHIYASYHAASGNLRTVDEVMVKE